MWYFQNDDKAYYQQRASLNIDFSKTKQIDLVNLDATLYDHDQVIGGASTHFIFDNYEIYSR